MVRRHEQNALRRYAIRVKRKQELALAKKQQQDDNNNNHNVKGSYMQQQQQQQRSSKSDCRSSKATSPESLSLSTNNSNNTVLLSQESNRGGRQRKAATCSFFCCLESVCCFPLRIRRFLRHQSDKLLSRVTLEAHYLGLKRGLEKDPSHGILEFGNVKTKQQRQKCTGDPLNDIIYYPEIPLYYNSLITGEKKLFIMEPKGGVGLRWREFLIRYYGPLLLHPISKAFVFLLFGSFLTVALYGCTKLSSGLDLKDLAPKGSYLNRYDELVEKHFDHYDFPVDAFFPEFQSWWHPEVQQSLRRMEVKMRNSGSGKLVVNPLLRMLDDPELSWALKSGDQEVRVFNICNSKIQYLQLIIFATQFCSCLKKRFTTLWRWKTANTNSSSKTLCGKALV